MSMELDKTADSGTGGAPAALAKGGSLGKYRLDRVLGEGGMGVVWAAHDPDLERAVAIKVLRYAQASPQLRQRLLREARAMAKLKHPNVLTVYEVGTVGDRDYIAMELVDGTTLDHWLAATPPPEEVWSAIIASGRGLVAAHAAGVVHRDFKPHNVLRSRDGRVLVTDFGLARGLLGEEDAASVDAATPLPEPSTTPALDTTMQAPAKVGSQSGRHGRDNDSVLDAPLTQTGALIGTPAYMAPEQYEGAPPDPRTDQFAFCVTAWQALTGERPFKGQTLEEMRKAVGGGVSHLVTKLPRDVRVVLVRGLDPRAQLRWPSLEELLDELERAARRPVRRRRLAFAAVSTVVIVAAVAFALTRKKDAVANACDAPEDAFAEAWSPSVRSALARTQGVEQQTLGRVAGAFDQFRERWITGYQKACRTKTAKVFPARIQCLEAVRDQVSALTFMLRSAPAPVFGAFDAHGMMPNLGSCERAEPDAPPPYPRDQPRRSRVMALMARAIALQGLPLAQLDIAVEGLEREATLVGWKPAEPAVRFTAGGAYLGHGQVTKARALFRRALEGFRERETADRRFEAVTYLGLVDAAVAELAMPSSPVPSKRDDPRADPVLHPELREVFAAAATAARDDVMLLAGLATNVAVANGHLAQWGRYRSAYAEAIAKAQEARKQFESIGDVRRAALSSGIEAGIYLERGDDRALDDALFAARRAADALEAAGLRPLYQIDALRHEVAFARREYNEVHRIIDKYAQPRTSATATVTGKVAPAGRARVIAWRGALVGDPKRAYIDAGITELDVVESDESGVFSVHAEPGWVIVAERGDMRSLPQLVVGATVTPTLTLKQTTTVSGTARGRNLLGVHAFAEMRLGESSWAIEVPIERDGTFDLRGIPAGAAPMFGTTGDAGHGKRRVVAGPSGKDLRWPYGQAIEVIVRAKQYDNARVWIVRGRLSTDVMRRGQLERLIRGTADSASAEVQPIGATNTDSGREHYKPGDRHAVITGNEGGEVTACAAAAGGDEAPAKCTTFPVEAQPVIEYPDGRFAAGVTPIVLEL